MRYFESQKAVSFILGGFQMNVLICDDEWSVTEQVSELLQKHCAETGTQVRFHLFDAPCAIKDFAEYDICQFRIDRYPGKSYSLSGVKSANHYHAPDP